ncbi:MAG: DUF5317 family protein [Candidatus Limiplasma sp.]|nr:DUF5317 family protein [Candidatus Limiplasma sp.]MEA5145938.1 DUF5317 family protein [Candidatus Limiplasma sp.]
MIVEIILVCLLAKLKRFRLQFLWRTWTFYPVLLVQLMAIAFQVSFFLHSTVFVPFAGYLIPAVILSFLFPMVAFSLYTPAMIGVGCIAAGSVLNRLVIAANGGHMPVYPTLSYLTGYARPDMFGVLDTLHVLGGEGTRLAFLSDVIDFGYSILSIGDVLIHLYVCIMLYALIRAVNARYGVTETGRSIGRSAAQN